MASRWTGPLRPSSDRKEHSKAYHGPPDGSAFGVAILVAGMGLPDHDALRLWRAVITSQHPHVRAMADDIVRLDTKSGRRVYGEWLTGRCAPKKCCEILET